MCPKCGETDFSGSYKSRSIYADYIILDQCGQIDVADVEFNPNDLWPEQLYDLHCKSCDWCFVDEFKRDITLPEARRYLDPNVETGESPMGMLGLA